MLKAQAAKIEELEKSIKYLNENFCKASNKYNSLVDIIEARARAVNQTLADHQFQVGVFFSTKCLWIAHVYPR
jgi:peptidoglycan hydrolase CwlO-like protein